MKNIVVYYSHTGNNKYLAEKTAEALGCEAVSLKPRLPGFICLLLASATGISLGNKSLKIDLEKYESVVLCGPIWMGQIAAPHTDFLKKYMKDIKKLSYITFCSSSDESRNDKFGYGTIFTKMKERLGDKCELCEAFPVDLILPDEQKDEHQAKLNARLTDSNFNGEIRERFDRYIGKIAGR